MTTVQYSLMTWPSLTVVPLTSMIQNKAVSDGCADTSQRSATLRSPSEANVGGHVITGRSDHKVYTEATQHFCGFAKSESK